MTISHQMLRSSPISVKKLVAATPTITGGTIIGVRSAIESAFFMGNGFRTNPMAVSVPIAPASIAAAIPTCVLTQTALRNISSLKNSTYHSSVSPSGGKVAIRCELKSC